MTHNFRGQFCKPEDRRFVCLNALYSVTGFDKEQVRKRFTNKDEGVGSVNFISNEVTTFVITRGGDAHLHFSSQSFFQR